MGENMRYTDEDIAMIDGVIGALYPRMPESSLRESYRNVHEHRQAGAVNASDLKRIESALELADPGQCTSFHKEDYRNYTQLRVKTRAMLRNA